MAPVIQIEFCGAEPQDICESLARGDRLVGAPSERAGAHRPPRREATMHRFANLKHGLATALISLTVALVALALPLTALAGNGSPGGI